MPCVYYCFSAQALSAVFTSDKLLLTVLISVLHANVEKVANLDSSNAVAVETNGHCSGANKQYLGEAAGKLWRQKSATLPAKQKHESCTCRRLSEPLIRSVERRQTSMTVTDSNISHADGTCDHSSGVIENSQLDDAVSKLFGFQNNPVWVSSTVRNQGCVATATCSDEPLVVNLVHGSDDCSALKSLSFEKKDSCLREHTSALNQVLCVPESSENGPASDQRMLSSSAQEGRCRSVVAVTPAFSDCVAEEDFTFLEVPDSDYDPPARRRGYTDVSRQAHSADDEANDVCTHFQYRKVCVYLQEGTWRHSPHSLHCIRIDDNISLVVLCEVMSLLLWLLCLTLCCLHSMWSRVYVMVKCLSVCLTHQSAVAAGRFAAGRRY